MLHFFEAVQKAFPKMTDFEKRDGDEYMLEEDRDAGSYRWVLARRPPARAPASSTRRPSKTPTRTTSASSRWPRTTSTCGGLQTESMDVLYYFDFVYQGNHDEVVAEALASRRPARRADPDAGGPACCTTSRR